jgi:cytochrome c-type biogenesis protein CcmF
LDLHNHVQHPPDWSLALGTTGRGLIFLAILAFGISAFGWLLSARNPNLKRVGAWGFTLGCLSLLGTFGVLASLFIAPRLEYEYVWGHTSTVYTLPYRIAGIWSGQQGSFLLWACSAALFGLWAVRGSGEYRRWFTMVYAVFLACIAGILAYETPFKLIIEAGQVVVPDQGVGLSPALENYWVTIHPPVIFLGFGSLTVLAAFAFAAMATRSYGSWVNLVRPWAILATTLTGVGLCMGGFWAYETLGWGGFWMWDPVENVSFVPWILSAALIHGLMVQIVRKRWTITNLMLAGLPFLTFVYGTFMTRSGVLSETSVHSFAEMDNVALKLLLGFMVASSLGFLGLWSYRAIEFRRTLAEPDAPPTGMHREGFYRAGALMLVLMGLVTAIGMSVPMFMSIVGKKPQMVQEVTYHRVLAWIYIPLLILMAAAPLVAWKGMGTREFMKRIYGVLCVTLLLIGLSMVATSMSPWVRNMPPESAVTVLPPFELFGQRFQTPKIMALPWVTILVGLSIAVFVANAWRIAELFKRSKLSSAAFLNHMGIAVLMAGLIISRGLERKDQIMFQEGSHDGVLGYLIDYKGQTSTETDRNNKVLFEMNNGLEKWTASPGFYYSVAMDGRRTPVSWPHIRRSPFYDMYFALHPTVTEATEAMQLAPGQSLKMDRYDVRFMEITRDGEQGSLGTKFGAKVAVGLNGVEHILEPQMEIVPGGTKDHPVAVDQNLMLAVKGMDVSTGAVTLQMMFQKPIYPIEVFYKPMTILVWLGTGMMAFAGLLSAWYRRPRRPTDPPQAPGAKEPVPMPELVLEREKVPLFYSKKSKHQKA